MSVAQARVDFTKKVYLRYWRFSGETIVPELMGFDAHLYRTEGEVT